MLGGVSWAAMQAAWQPTAHRRCVPGRCEATRHQLGRGTRADALSRVRGGLRAGVCEVAERADASSRAGRARVASRRRGLRPKPWPRRVFRLDY